MHWLAAGVSNYSLNWEYLEQGGVGPSSGELAKLATGQKLIGSVFQ